MDAPARVTSKGQVTIPKEVRDAIDIAQGDSVIFRIVRDHAVMARTPEFVSLAGAIEISIKKRNVAWGDVLRRTRSSRSTKRR